MDLSVTISQRRRCMRFSRFTVRNYVTNTTEWLRSSTHNHDHGISFIASSSWRRFEASTTREDCLIAHTSSTTERCVPCHDSDHRKWSTLCLLCLCHRIHFERLVRDQSSVMRTIHSSMPDVRVCLWTDSRCGSTRWFDVLCHRCSLVDESSRSLGSSRGFDSLVPLSTERRFQWSTEQTGWFVLLVVDWSDFEITREKYTDWCAIKWNLSTRHRIKTDGWI